MAELDNKSIFSPQAHTSNHRLLLKEVNQNVDSASDKDGTSDDETDLLELPRDGGEAVNILGVSMSRAQTHMKSVHTPAHEKAQALERSRNYFDPEELADGGVSGHLALEAVDKNENRTSVGVTDERPTPWKSQQPSNQRYSVTRAILGHSGNRKRSSSGPTAVLDNIRKLFTDLPSYPGFNSNPKEPKEDAPTGIGGSPLKHETEGSRQRPEFMVRPLTSSVSRNGLDGTVSSSEHEEPHPKLVRRSTSDNSLYLRRTVTGASNFDDTAAFSNVAEMPNPRFKAITDSLADSSIKMPKFPGRGFLSSRSSSMRQISDMTKNDTSSNSNTIDVPTSTVRKTLQTENGTQYFDSNEHKHPILSGALANTTGDMVIMGGYRGSVLRLAEPPYHQLWVPVKVGLNMRKADLEIGLSHADEEKMEEKIVPSGILSHIGPIDIARRLLKKLRKCPNVRSACLRIHDWGYDWRLSPHLLSQKLIKFLEGLPCNQPGMPTEKRGALVIAHSLGGLITRHAVNQRPELFSGIVYAGAPQNCCNILGPLRNGDDVLLSSRVLTAQVNFTLRTSYALLPEDGRCFLNRETGERYDIDFFNIDSWDEYRLSPCINPALPSQSQSQPRKGIVESISDSISSFQSKRTSWFSNPLSTEPSNTSPTRDTVKDEATEIKDDIASTAKKAAEHIQSPKQEAQDSLEPSMKPSSHKPTVATAVSIPKDQAWEYLERTLAEVKQFKTELNHIQANQDANRYPPHAIIYGKSVPTVYGAKVASREAIKQADAYDDLAFAAGDGVVLASAAQLPAGYRCVVGGRVESDRGHIGLLGDLEGIGQCIMAVVDGRRRGIGLGLGLP